MLCVLKMHDVFWRNTQCDTKIISLIIISQCVGMSFRINFGPSYVFKCMRCVYKTILFQISHNVLKSHVSNKHSITLITAIVAAGMPKSFKSFISLWQTTAATAAAITIGNCCRRWCLSFLTLQFPFVSFTVVLIDVDDFPPFLYFR